MGVDKMEFDRFIDEFQVKKVIEESKNTEQSPMVSVLVQTYQHVGFIRDCLDGILMQKTNFPFEILLGDDGSVDGTREIVKDYANKHPNNIRLFWHNRENNIAIGGRPTGRFNFLYNIFSAKGKYIALCEGDDYWTDPLKLQKQVDFMEANPEYSLVFTNGKIKYSNESIPEHLIYTNSIAKGTTPYNASPIPNETTDIHTLANGNYIHTAGVLFVNWFKDGVPAYMAKVTIGDWPLHMTTATKGLIKYMDDTTFCYRVHNQGVYSKRSKLDKLKMTIGQFSPMLNSGTFNEEVRKIIEAYCLKSTSNYIKKSNTQEEYEYIVDMLVSIENPALQKQITLQLIQKILFLTKQIEALKPYKEFNLKRVATLFIKKYLKKQ